MNLTPEQRATLLILFHAYYIEQAVIEVQGYRPPWAMSIAAAVFPYRLR